MTKSLIWSCLDDGHSCITSTSKWQLGQVWNIFNGSTRVLIRFGYTPRNLARLPNNSLIDNVTLASRELWRRCCLMTPFESNNKRFRIKPETGYTIASTEEQEGIVLGLRAIADAATVSSEWIIWTIIGDGYTLRDHKVEIDRKLIWHQFIEIKLGLHGTDQCQVWVVPHGALDQWDSRTTSLMIGTALDATNGQIGFLEVPNMVANWTIPIMFTIPYSFNRYVLLVRPFLSSFKNRLDHVLHRIIWYDWF